MPLFDKLTIVTDAFAPLGRIPDRYAADGGNEAPVLSISGAPAGTVELAVIVHDPDAPLPNGFTHWTVYGIPADVTTVDESTGRPGPNGIGAPGYTGPQPPAGHGEHHYYFWVYALGRPVSGEPSREQFLADYADAVLEQARVVGTFSTPAA